VRDGLALGVDRAEVVGEAALLRARVRVGVGVRVRVGVGVKVRVGAGGQG